ncbi:unnamed protein product [Prunus armeniaca]
MSSVLQPPCKQDTELDNSDSCEGLFLPAANGLGCCKRWTEEIAPFRLGSKIKPQNTSKGQRNLRRYFELSMSGMRHGEQNNMGLAPREKLGLVYEE